MNRKKNKNKTVTVKSISQEPNIQTVWELRKGKCLKHGDFKSTKMLNQIESKGAPDQLYLFLVGGNSLMITLTMISL